MSTRQPSWVDSKSAAILSHKGYVLDKKLGAGAFGVVYKAKKGSRGECACKVMDLKACDQTMKAKYLPREIHSLKKFRHPYAIEVYDIFRMSDKIWIMMELASGGTVEKYCLKQKNPLKEEHAGYWMNQICAAITSLHALSIAHRDLKLENVMLSDKMVCKVTDLGFTRVVSKELSRTFCGTWIFFCPELVNMEPYDPFLADSWALGVMLYAMVTRRYPFHYEDQERFIKEQMDVAFRDKSEFTKLSKDCRSILLKLLEPDPKRRMHVSATLKHEWMKKNRKRPGNLGPGPSKSGASRGGRSKMSRRSRGPASSRGGSSRRSKASSRGGRSSSSSASKSGSKASKAGKKGGKKKGKKGSSDSGGSDDDDSGGDDDDGGDDEGGDDEGGDDEGGDDEGGDDDGGDE